MSGKWVENEQQISGEKMVESVNMWSEKTVGLYNGGWGTMLEFFRTNTADMGGIAFSVRRPKCGPERDGMG